SSTGSTGARAKETAPRPLREGGSTGSGRPRSAATAKAATRAGPASRPGGPARRSPSATRPGPPVARPPVVIQPPLLPSLARGLVVAGTSPVLLASGFLATLVLWLIY